MPGLNAQIRTLKQKVADQEAAYDKLQAKHTKLKTTYKSAVESNVAYGRQAQDAKTDAKTAIKERQQIENAMAVLERRLQEREIELQRTKVRIMELELEFKKRDKADERREEAHDKETAQLMATMETLGSDLQAHDERLVAAEHLLGQALAHAQTLILSLSLLAATTAALSAELTHQTSLREALEASMTGLLAELDATEGDLDEARKITAEILAQFDQLRATYQEEKDAHAVTREQMANAEHEHLTLADEQAARIAALEAELAERDAQITTLTDKATFSHGLSGARLRQFQQAMELVNKAETRAARLESENQRLRTELRQKDARITTLEAADKEDYEFVNATYDGQVLKQ